MKIATVLTICLVLIGLIVPAPQPANAGLIDDLKQQIEDRNAKLNEINEEIEEYQEKVQEVGKERQTLQTTVSQLNLSEQRLLKNISATESQIGTAELTIEKLSLEIEDIEESVDDNRDALREALRVINLSDDQSLIESMLIYDSLAEVWNEAEELSRFKERVQDRVGALEDLRDQLHTKISEHVSTKENLEEYKEEVEDQRSLVEITKKEKDALLSKTKSEEAAFNRLLQEKVTQREAFERELFDLESQLNIAIDPSKLPAVGKGVLRWPLSSIVITQQFGRTSDSGRLYASGTHNGVDFGIAVGTPVLSAQSGTVWATGNTDVGSCLSYGKWVLVKHNNGLSTLYAHLSLIKAKEGQVINAGDVIGYSGNTGYSTGPHLHFTVYATEGVRVQQYTNSINCKNVVIPVADSKAYLDPLAYL